MYQQGLCLYHTFAGLVVLYAVRVQKNTAVTLELFSLWRCSQLGRTGLRESPLLFTGSPTEKSRRKQRQLNFPRLQMCRERCVSYGLQSLLNPMTSKLTIYKQRKQSDPAPRQPEQTRRPGCCCCFPRPSGEDLAFQWQNLSPPPREGHQTHPEQDETECAASYLLGIEKRSNVSAAVTLNLHICTSKTHLGCIN